MRAALFGLMIGLAIGPVSMAATPEAEAMAPIQKFIASFNKGDLAAAEATHAATSDLTIVDEAPPFHWSGPKAFGTWIADLTASDQKQGVTDGAVELGKPTRVETSDKVAYVIVPVVYTFKQKGVPMREPAQMTYVVKQDAKGWLIHSWTWTGPAPTKAAAK